MGVTKTDAYTDRQLRRAHLCKALGHPARIAILEHLLQADCCICQDLTDLIDLSQPTLSRHLQVLRETGLITGTPEANTRNYCIDRERWSAAQKELDGFFSELKGCE